MNSKKLPLNAQALLLKKVADDYHLYVNSGAKYCPKSTIYRFTSRDEDVLVGIKARKAALKELNKPIQKYAFDTRRVNQEQEANPRRNLQFWHRSEEFIDDADQDKINTFAKLHNVLKNIQEDFCTRPDWHDSYARILNDAVERALKIKQGGDDIDRAQLAYLEQLLDARYRLSMEQINKQSSSDLRDCILKKDENLLKRGLIYDNAETNKPKFITNNMDYSNDRMSNLEDKFMYLLSKAMVKDSRAPEPNPNIINVYPAESSKNDKDANSVLASLFSGGMRRDGEKNVERTITITIKDNVVD